MGSRKYTSNGSSKTLVTFFRVNLGISNAVLICAAWVVLLIAGSQASFAQATFVDPPVPPSLDRIELPPNYRLPPSGGLRDSFQTNTGQYGVESTAPSRTHRTRTGRTIPTLRARYRRQDGDLFGESQAESGDAAGGSIFDALENGPQPPATKRPTQNNSSGGATQGNPFGEPETRTPFDPSPREPLMDTKREEPTLQPRPEKRTPLRSVREGSPQLPDGSEFTPDARSIPELPMPDGGTRSTEKAGTTRAAEDTSPNLPLPEEEDIEDALIEFNDDLEGYDLVDPRDRPRESSGSSRRRQTTNRERSRSKASNVYRPAREPSYYSRPTDTYGQYPPGYRADSTYGAQPYAQSNAMEAIVQTAVEQAMRNYAANPANTAVAPYYGRGCACPPSPDCGCGPQGAQAFSANPELILSQQFTQPSSSHCPPTVANEVYEGVVCGEKEIESYNPQRFPYKNSGLGIGGLSLGAIRNSGPNVYYGSVFGGWAGLDDLMLSGEEGQIQIENDDGFAAGFAFGQIQGKNLRSEIEVTYRSNDLNGMSLSDQAGAIQLLEGDGTIESISGMFNVFWDFTDAPTGRLKPYLGFGFGGVSADADFEVDGMSTLDDGNDTSLAYQWIGGINFQTSERSDFYVEYRYFVADSLHFNTTLPTGSIIDSAGELEYRTSNVVFGLRMKF